MNRTKIALATEITEGQTRKFKFTRNGRPVEGFLVRFQGQLVAYENTCRHLPVSLDFNKGTFFTADGLHFVCQTHGATYEPLTGLCVLGPCQGQSLKPLAIEVIADDIWLCVP